MDEFDEERELRILLERAVPEQAAPAERMRQIRIRVVRRRWRRAIATAGAVTGVVAVTLFGTVLRPFDQGPDLRAEQPAGPGRPQAAPTYDGESSVRKVPDFFGLTATVPESWDMVTSIDTRSQTTVFISTQRVTARDACPDEWSSDFSCEPVSKLDKGGVLIAFRQTDDHPLSNTGKKFVPEPVGPAQDDCRNLGGTREELVYGPGHKYGARATVNAYVCFNSPSTTTLNMVDKIFATAAFAED
jgi:hypothetical protein